MTRVSDLMDLRDRTAVITGASGHLGRMMAVALAELGASLILVDRPGSDFAALERSVASVAPVAVESIGCDLECTDNRAKLVADVGSGRSSIDVLVNNAAFVGTADLAGWAEPFERQSIETWRRAIEVNLTAPFHLCQQLAPLLRRSSHASVINVGSIYGCYGPDYRLYEDTAMSNPGAYGASKGGLIQLTRWLSTTLAPSVRVNAISPGGVFRNQPASFVERYKARTPLARMASEDDFIGVIVFLATDMSRYVTGQNICVDGGWGVW